MVVSVEVDVSSERNLGLIGSILALAAGFFGAVPYIGVFGSILSLVGFVLILIALKGVGDKAGDGRPFRYYLYGFIVAVGGIVLAVIIVLAGVLALHPSSGEGVVFHGSHPIGIGESTSVVYDLDQGTQSSTVLGLIVIVAIAVIVVFILAAYFQKKAWEAMYDITGVKEFADTAKWLWWGALTLIILVGAILLLISAIYQILAFSNMPEKLRPGEGSTETGMDEVIF
ncbi:DUF996 domain-containing protein [Thermococcus sp.]|uniref:DUF996 domain-containing protein n=1 Tax=Thermococcus sp. TaxID=35749 RepID=UPI0026106D1B|nr:DUF996 domain-containing protein [Thermococcus sp.]